MKIDINLLYMQFKYHFTSTEHLEICTIFGNVRRGSVLEAIVFLKLIMCHLDLCTLYHSTSCYAICGS